ncbi:MAG: FAD-dependent oxidoreductase, partial [Actinomycetota bacterium]
LSESQWASIGWRNRQGIGEMPNQFHYFRVTADGRILWGGYDAIYRFGNGVDSRFEERPQTFALLATHFFQTFPQLEGLRFSHRWAGAIDTCSRFSVFFGTALDGRVAYAAGYTGLGVGATRFGARVALDLVDGSDTARTRLRMVRKKPIPFPPEPLRYLGIQLTRRALERADRRHGRRGPWLRLLDALGLGFDS